MAMKYLKLFLLLCFFSCSRREFNSISKKVDLIYRGNKKNDKLTFHDVRMKVLENRNLHFLRTNIDTLFILETYREEEALYSGKIWNSKGNVIYKYQFGRIDYSDKNMFTKQMEFLLEKWDTTSIRFEDLNYSNIVPSSRVYGTRVISKSGKCKIDTISFNFFFKAERDRYGKPALRHIPQGMVKG